MRGKWRELEGTGSLLDLHTNPDKSYKHPEKENNLYMFKEQNISELAKEKETDDILKLLFDLVKPQP